MAKMSVASKQEKNTFEGTICFAVGNTSVTGIHT